MKLDSSMLINGLFNPQTAKLYLYFALLFIFIIFVRFVIYLLSKNQGRRTKARELGMLSQAIFIFLLLAIIYLYSKYFQSDPGLFFIYVFIFISAMAAIFWSGRRLINRHRGVETKISNKCPLCGSQLVLRTARKGTNAGNDFYGCSNYPNCRYTKNVS